MPGLLTEIDHVAIAVNDLEAAIAYYKDAFGAEVHHREVVEREGVEEALLKVADSYIQLTTATREDSPVGKFLASRGEGVHHIGYRVDDCAAHLHQPQGVACMQGGCLARRACPVGVDNRYKPEHAAFHMAAFADRRSASLASRQS